MDKYMDYWKALPTLMQFVLLFLSVAGTSGLLTGIFAIWKLYVKAGTDKQAAADARAMRESQARIERELAEQKSRHEKELAEQKSRHEKELAEQKARIDALELRRIQAQSEAKQAESASENMQKLIDALATGNERWQHVVDVKSERQLEADRLQYETNKMFIAAVKQQTETVANITEMLEIQSEHLGGFGRVMQHFDDKLDTTLKTVEISSRDNRADLTTALGMSVTSRTESENTLRAIKDSIHQVVREVTHIIENDKRQQADNLLSIKTQLQSIETLLMQPDPVTPVPPEPLADDDAA
jgi:hypothetical protein